MRSRFSDQEGVGRSPSAEGCRPVVDRKCAHGSLWDPHRPLAGWSSAECRSTSSLDPLVVRTAERSTGYGRPQIFVRAGGDPDVTGGTLLRALGTYVGLSFPAFKPQSEGFATSLGASWDDRIHP